jgi:hypothetical protein
MVGINLAAEEHLTPSNSRFVNQRMSCSYSFSWGRFEPFGKRRKEFVPQRGTEARPGRTSGSERVNVG